MENENQYDLGNLIKTFEKHAIQADENLISDRKRFLENNPGEKMPEYLKNDFNICRALLTICKEIEKLKN